MGSVKESYSNPMVLGTVLEAFLFLIPLSVCDNPMRPLVVFTFYK